MKKFRTTGFIEEAFGRHSYNRVRIFKDLHTFFPFLLFFIVSKIADLQARSAALGAAL